MKYNTRQQRNFTFRQIVKRKNKKTRKQENKKIIKQRNFTFRQIVKHKNKKTRKQQRGGWLRSIYDMIMPSNRIQPSEVAAARARAAAASTQALQAAARARERIVSSWQEPEEEEEEVVRVVETDNRGVIVMDRVMDRPVAQGIPVASTVRVPVNTAISSIRDSAQVDAAALVGVPVTSSDVEYDGREYYFDHVLGLDGYSGEGSVADGIPVVVVHGVEPRQSGGIQVH